MTAFVSMFVDPYSRYPSNPHTAMERHPPYVSKFSWADPNGFYILLPTCIYAQILHHSVPGLVSCIKRYSNDTTQSVNQLKIRNICQRFLHQHLLLPTPSIQYWELF